VSSLPANLRPTVQKLQYAQRIFLQAADSVASPDWTIQPARSSWSAGHVVSHLCLVERNTLAYADRVIRKTARPVTLFQRLHLPIALAEHRIIKRKAPVSVAPVDLTSKETMIAELRGVRERTLAFLEETHGRDLCAYRWPHPFLGRLNFYEWFTFIAAHQIRHTKQLVEIVSALPKDVASSQKQ
jgi:hypothetical protein